MWEYNEIENYLLDQKALVYALDMQAVKSCCATAEKWQEKRCAFEDKFRSLVCDQRDSVRNRVADRIQKENRKLGVPTVLEETDKRMEHEWCRLERWCDAKQVLSDLRAWLREQGFDGFTINDNDIIAAMENVPCDVRVLLEDLKKTIG